MHGAAPGDGGDLPFQVVFIRCGGVGALLDSEELVTGGFQIFVASVNERRRD